MEKALHLQTKYFGIVDCDEEDILTFPSGLFGFEEEHRFILLPFADSESAMLCLQSAETPGLAFIVMNPFMLKADYTPVLQPAELQVMEAAHSTELCYYVMCVVRTPASQSTVNLRCPIVINDTTRRAMQVILDDGGYAMRHLLSDFSQEGEPC